MMAIIVLTLIVKHINFLCNLNYQTKEVKMKIVKTFVMLLMT
jgi:hypothetical protein